MTEGGVRYLLDTNIVSEMFRPEPDPGVIAWLSETPRDHLMLAAVVVGELYLGLALMPEGQRRNRLLAMTEEFIASGGDEAILPYSKGESLLYAEIAARRRRMGRPITEFDAQIAATAAFSKLTLVTRNVRDFEHCGITVFNPWAKTT